MTFKVTIPEGSQSLCWIPMLGSLLWGLELSQQYENFFGIIVLQCGSPTQQLYSGANGALLQEDVCYMPHIPRLLLPEPLSQQQATADSCLSNTHREGWFILMLGAGAGRREGGDGSHCSFPWVLMPQSFVCALQVSLVGMRFDFTRDCAPPTILLQLLLCPWVWAIFFSEFQHPAVDVWSPASCNFGVPTGDQHTSFYSIILVYRLNPYN